MNKDKVVVQVESDVKFANANIITNLDYVVVRPYDVLNTEEQKLYWELLKEKGYYLYGNSYSNYNGKMNGYTIKNYEHTR